MMEDLFASQTDNPTPLRLGEGVMLLPGYARQLADDLLGDIDLLTVTAPFRHMLTPGGQAMSVAMSNCGELGWISDRRGYRYSPIDPHSGLPWPAMPAHWRDLAATAAQLAGFAGFNSNACLINRYAPACRMGLHQDRDERDFNHPIVTVSLGLPARFLLGGMTRSGPTSKIPLLHGDVIVWGGVDRLRFHGIAPLAEGLHPRAGAYRLSLTFRRA
ncbi:DNA oxidative demethylase AlkB [uncultured Aquitalea sp.]|uniref:DNA oxidative demethylase AlkB n=1 Tax=uncultured Aquitalea sp. TaxID=540272 RepID=UPI0025F37E5B|nr:DNA oxidative demethylase AlkB [uncultured Aquitalea sp.]